MRKAERDVVRQRFDNAILNPVKEQRARTPDDPTGYINRHELAFHTPRPGFEAAISCGIVALRDYACAHEEEYESKLADDGVLGDAWLDAWRGFRAMLNGSTGRLDCGFLDGALCNLRREAGFGEEG